jgi:hypothetical protein
MGAEKILGKVNPRFTRVGISPISTSEAPSFFKNIGITVAVEAKVSARPHNPDCVAPSIKFFLYCLQERLSGSLICQF